jgi:hypothetical protein
MNPSYVQTFNRHRLLFSLPVVIMTVLAIWFVAGTPKQYKAGASLFVDTPVTQPSSFQDPNPGDVTPAAQSQQLLNELLSTRSFRLKVGRQGPLTKYLATHPGEGWGPKGLLGKLRPRGSAEDRTWNALDTKHVITALPGNQIMSIELHGPTPKVAVRTLRALLTTFARERQAIDVARQARGVSHYKNQLDTAQAQLDDINARIASGEISPEAALALQRAAQARVRRATRAVGQARFSLDAAKGSGPMYQVIDKPSLPAPAVRGMKKSLFGVVAGIFVGCLISLLAIVLLTGSNDKEREREELREVIARADDDAPLDVEHATGTNGSAVPQVPRVKATGER